MFLISVIVAVISRGLTAEILLVFLLFVAFFFAARFGTFLSRIESLQKVIEELSHATAPIKVRAAFSTLLIFVVFAEALGIEIIVGAFLAGAIVALLRTPEDRELSSQLEAIAFGFFIPIFFIMVGAISICRLGFVHRALVSCHAAHGSRRGQSNSGPWYSPIKHGERSCRRDSVCSRLSLIIAAAAIGEKLGIIDASVNAGIVLVAIVTVTASPLAFFRVFPAPLKVGRSNATDTELAAP